MSCDHNARMPHGSNRDMARHLLDLVAAMPEDQSRDWPTAVGVSAVAFALLDVADAIREFSFNRTGYPLPNTFGKGHSDD